MSGSSTAPTSVHIHGVVVIVIGLGTVFMALCTRSFEFEAFDLDPLIYHAPHLWDLSIHMLLPHITSCSVNVVVVFITA